MASDVASDEPIPAAPAAEPSPPTPRLYGARFLFVYGALALALAGAVAGLVLAIARSGTVGGGPAWSSWKPSGGGDGAAQQIANHVSPTYRLPNGLQLGQVLVKPPTVPQSSGKDLPLHYIVVEGKKNAVNKVYKVSSSNTVFYTVCGLGQSCSIATGKPSIARGTLVRREILELALYTFKYIRGMDNVLAFMPPKGGTAPQYVVLLKRSDLSNALKTPLTRTLGAHVPLPNTIPAREVRAIDAATVSQIFRLGGVTQAPTGELVLVLGPAA